MQYNIRAELNYHRDIIEMEMPDGDQIFSKSTMRNIVTAGMYTGATSTLELLNRAIAEISQKREYDLTQEEILAIMDTFGEQTDEEISLME